LRAAAFFAAAFPVAADFLAAAFRAVVFLVVVAFLAAVFPVVFFGLAIFLSLRRISGEVNFRTFGSSHRNAVDLL
jgi:hypothetical protein